MNVRLVARLIFIICFYSSCYGLETPLTGGIAHVQATDTPSKIQNCFARYTLHALYISTLLTAIIGGYFLAKYVQKETGSLKESCHSMQGTCNDCTDIVGQLKPYLLAIANFTQGCPNAMSELQVATFFSMLNCRDENKCKPLPQFTKPNK